MRHLTLGLVCTGLLGLASCDKEDIHPDRTPGPAEPRLVLRFKFDSTQVRLDNLGHPAGVPAGHGAQSPRFNSMSAHYVEFAPLASTLLGQGDVVYRAAETDAGGANAIDHAQSTMAGDSGTFLSIPLSELTAGTYRWLRVSLAYQNYDVALRVNTPLSLDLAGTVASFIGFNTYISSYLIHDSTVTVNDDRLQGYWAFEVIDPPYPVPVASGQAPGTTVPNPLNDTSPIPAGSCVVTGAFATPLTITGNETSDVTIVVSLSTNKSFEWTESDGDNMWEPTEGETVTDMGIRGMIPLVQ